LSGARAKEKLAWKSDTSMSWNEAELIGLKVVAGWVRMGSGGILSSSWDSSVGVVLSRKARKEGDAGSMGASDSHCA
jgi:hypothetical protein